MAIPKVRFAIFIPAILGDPKIPNVGHMTPHDPFELILQFFSLVLTTIHLYAEFELYTFICLRDIRRSHNYKSRSHHPRETF